MDKINEMGRMYVVWHNKPEVESQQDGMNKVIESIGWTGAEYGNEITDIVRIVQESAQDQADNTAEAKGRNYENRDNIYHHEIKNYGRRAVYEIRIRHIGYADAEGRFEKTLKKSRRKK